MTERATHALARAVLVRIARESDGGARAATALAVLGDGADLHRVASLAEIDIDAGSRAVDALAAVDVLATRRPVRFGHPYGSLPRDPFQRPKMR